MTIKQICDATIGKPKTLRGTSIFPIFTDPTAGSDFEIATDQLEIGELASASVPDLCVHNPTEKPVVIPAGKILSGGRQTRTVNVSIVVYPDATVIIPVSCVEQGRWGGTQRFRDSNRMASKRVRLQKEMSVRENILRYGSKNSDQSKVWNAINVELHSRGIYAPTSNFLDADYQLEREYDRQAVIDEFLHIGPQDGQTGVVVSYGGEISGLEIFPSPRALSQYWEAIIRSAVLDSPLGAKRPATQAKVKKFVDDVASAPATTAPGVGGGTELHIQHRELVGQALVVDGKLLHANAFANSVS
jgi:hypothetical protein